MQEGQREELKEGEEEEGEEAMTAMFSQQANGNFRNPCEESTRRLLMFIREIEYSVITY